jgi:hypothetical protein
MKGLMTESLGFGTKHYGHTVIKAGRLSRDGILFVRRRGAAAGVRMGCSSTCCRENRPSARADRIDTDSRIVDLIVERWGAERPQGLPNYAARSERITHEPASTVPTKRPPAHAP